MPRKLFVIACEPSGDLHGADLVRELRKREPGLEARGLGGPRLAGEGVRVLEDMTRISALGWGDVVRQYFTYRRIFYRALADAERFRPDALVLIDSPAFNLRFAKKIRKRFPVLYFIAPQIWAWGGRRIATIRETVSHMLVILPFEVNLYERAGVPCTFVGHPLLDATAAALEKDARALRSELAIPENARAVGLLPGSRESEVRRILPAMLDSAARLREKMPDTVFLLTRAPNIDPGLYERILAGCPLPVRSAEGRFYDVIRALDFAFVTSGTATLETALLGTPFFLFYKTGWTTYFLGKNLIRVPYLGLVNLLASRRVMPEFIQTGIRPREIARKAESLLKDPAALAAMKRAFSEIRTSLGAPGASARAAEAVSRFLGGDQA